MIRAHTGERIQSPISTMHPCQDEFVHEVGVIFMLQDSRNVGHGPFTLLDTRNIVHIDAYLDGGSTKTSSTLQNCKDLLK